MLAMRRVGVLFTLLLVVGLTGPVPLASATAGVTVTWPEQTRIGTQSYYRFEYADADPGFLWARWEGSGRWDPLPESGPAWVQIPEPGRHHVEVRRCTVEGCELVATSPDLDVYPEAGFGGLTGWALMGPRHLGMSISFTSPDGWDHASVRWELGRTATDPPLLGDIIDVSPSGEFAPALPPDLAAGDYVMRLFFTVHHPELGDFYSEMTTDVAWTPRTAGRFGATRRVVRPGASHFAGTVRTTTLLDSAEVVVLRRGHRVARPPVQVTRWGKRLRVTWDGRVRGRVRPGRYVVRVTWHDLAANTGTASRRVVIKAKR